MARRKKISFTFQRLFVLTFLFFGVGIAAWYFIIRDTSPKSIELQPLPNGFYAHGIDVSHHQGEIDWDSFFKKTDTTISFIYCKVSEGTNYIDPQWKRNHEKLSLGKIKHGGYHFFTPDVSGEIQANHFLHQYSPKKSELPPVLDAEVDASSDHGLVKGMKDWLRVVENRTGIRPVIYTSYSMYSDKMKGKFDGFQFWIASYNTDESRFQDSAIVHWQYTDKGKVPGIHEAVDLNFSKQRFHPPIELAN